VLELSFSIPVETVSTDIGDFVVLKNRHDRTSNHMRNGGQERWMHDIIDRHANKDKIAIDMGSSLGFHSAYMSRAFKHVIAFEPQRMVAGLSERSFFLNGLNNIEVYKMACSDANEKIELPVIDYNATKNVGGISMAYREDGDPNTNTGWDGISYTSVQSITLDELLSESFGSESVGFMKIDVEGFEYRALKGAKQTLRQSLCPLVVEIRDFPAGNFDRVDGLLMSIGYTDRENVGNSRWDYLYTGRE